MKKVSSFIIIIVLGIFLSSCDYLTIFTNDSITIDVLNHLSTEIIKANVRVKTYNYKDVFAGKRLEELKSSGSGVIFYTDFVNAFVLTNSHVVDLSFNDSIEYIIDDINNESYTAELVHSSRKYDLAILKFLHKGLITSLDFSKKNPKRNEVVYTISSPLGYRNIITAGRLRKFDKIDNVDFSVIIHDAIIQEGSSGSMLINKDYEIIGINSWGFYDVDNKDEFITAGAVPVEKIIEFLEAVGFYNEELI